MPETSTIMAGAAVGATAVAVVTCPALAIVPCLNLLGFSTFGPVAGTYAAG